MKSSNLANFHTNNDDTDPSTRCKLLAEEMKRVGQRDLVFALPKSKSNGGLTFSSSFRYAIYKRLFKHYAFLQTKNCCNESKLKDTCTMATVKKVPQFMKYFYLTGHFLEIQVKPDPFDQQLAIW